MFFQQPPPMFSAERLSTLEALIPLLQHTPAWPDRYAVEAYVWRCIAAGFCKTDDQARLCAERFIAGKRKVTPPGTARRLKAERKLKETLSKVPPELQAAIDAALAEQSKAIAQYKSGVEKALNAIVGSVMKRHKADPAIVKELLVRSIRELV